MEFPMRYESYIKFVQNLEVDDPVFIYRATVCLINAAYYLGGINALSRADGNKKVHNT